LIKLISSNGYISFLIGYKWLEGSQRIGIIKTK
jgi:hypothetical protein